MTGVRVSRRTALSALATVPALGLGSGVAGCSGDPGRTPNQPPTGPTGGLAARDWATGLSVPWGLEPVADDAVLVTERDTGKILRLSAGTVSTVAQVGDAVKGPEGGLLGLRLGPDHDRLFVYYTTEDDNRVVRYSWNGNQATDPRPILTGIPRAGVHNGGQLRFGSDGSLFVSTGDATVRDNAQDKRSLSGKILRITVEGDPAPGNPFGNEVWSYGHRNVQGLAFDDTGQLWASEFGQDTLDELNLISKGGNYGWPAIEGDESTIDGMTNPKQTWATDDCSPSGLDWWAGSLWMAGLRGERLWQIQVNGTGTGTPVAHFAGDYGRLRAVAAFPDGSGLLLGSSNADGRGTPKPGDDRLLKVAWT